MVRIRKLRRASGMYEIHQTQAQIAGDLRKTLMSDVCNVKVRKLLNLKSSLRRGSKDKWRML